MNKNFNLGSLIFILFLSGFLLTCGKKSTDADPFAYFKDKKFVVKRGVNISHWLSQSGRRGAERDSFFTASDMKFIASVNYDHVRIPIDEEQMWDSAGIKNKEAFELLNKSIIWAAENRLRVVVDLHILRSHHFNAKEKPLWTEPAAQDRFFQCWRDLSGELKKYPIGMLAYELLNEPVADDPQKWNELSQKALAVVRENEPDRKIIIGSNMWQSVNTFKDLVVPDKDKNIILSFHFYIPFLLTHHEASWTAIKDYHGPVFYPGLIVRDKDLAGLPPDLFQQIKSEQKYFTRDSLESLMMKPLIVARKYKLPLYCGEWGCLPTVPDSARFQWYRDMRYCLEKNGIAWTNWDYKGGFGIIDRNIESPNNELIRILTGD